jgi:outer membrane protein OmpA-like peptidoglycan-associated protein
MKRFLPLIFGLLAAVGFLWLLSKSCNRKPQELTQLPVKDEVVEKAEKDIAIARASIDPVTEKQLAALGNQGFEPGSVAQKVFEFIASGQKKFSKEVFLFKNAQFADQKFTLSPALATEISQLATLLKNFPNLRIEVDSHTDSTRDPLENNYLSQRRADAIRNALIANGISNERIIAHGFGSEVPIAPNDSPEGKAANRRVELLLSTAAK